MIQNINSSENHVLISLSGSIYVEEAAHIRESLIDYVAKGHKNIIIDFEKVDYIDSCGLGELVAIQKRAMQKEAV